jgi:hypothetical protein
MSHICRYICKGFHLIESFKNEMGKFHDFFTIIDSEKQNLQTSNLFSYLKRGLSDGNRT